MQNKGRRRAETGVVLVDEDDTPVTVVVVVGGIELCRMLSADMDIGQCLTCFTGVLFRGRP